MIWGDMKHEIQKISDEIRQANASLRIMGDALSGINREKSTSNKGDEEVFKRLANLEAKVAKLYEAIITHTPNGAERLTQTIKPRINTILEKIK